MESGEVIFPPAARVVSDAPERVLAMASPDELATRLRAIESVTDAALVHLELDPLLRELLNRIRDVLSVDTVRVLLCTAAGDALSVRASVGLDNGGEVIEIPFGHGIAGRVAARRVPVIVDDLGEIDVADPVLRRLASLMIAPLLVEGKLLGVLKVGTLRPRYFTDAELALLQLVADRVALAIDRARQYEAREAERAERHAAEQSLSASEQKFRLMVESVTDYAILMLDPSGRIVSWNAGAERINGYAEQEVLGRPFSIFYTPEDVARRHPEHELAVAAAQGRYEEEGWRVRKDGSRFWANVIITALRQEGELAGYAKVTRDLTGRKQAEEALRESEERFRVFSESASDALFTLGQDGLVLYTNPAVERIFGYRPDELRGRPMATLIPERLRSGHEVGVRRYVATGERRIPWTGVVLPGLRRDGTEVPLEISFGEYILGGKRYFTGIARDVSERIRQQHALEEAAAELEATIEELQIRTEDAEAANKAKSEFLAVMSHELRTPLTAIMGYAELMLEGIPDPIPDSVRKQLQRIDHAARHQLRLVEEILTFARLNSGREEVQLETVDLGELAREVVAVITPIAERKGVPVRVFAPPAPVLAPSDRAKVRLILANLLSNAVKFTRSGVITVRAGAGRETAQVSVEDTGIGIAAENLRKIFDPFWQIQQTNTREAEGTGMGLTVSQRVAELIGGEIRVRSTPGKGSAFTLLLPLAGPPDPPDPSASSHR